VIAGAGEVQGPDGCSGQADCEEAVHQLYHYLDGELTEVRRLQIVAHLDRCAPCAQAADFEAELRQIIADRCRDHVPESLVQRIAEAIDEEARRHGPGVQSPPAPDRSARS
jgi:mycothiol system anti-sigma-R factor